MSDGYSFMIEMLFLAEQRGYRIVEVPITFVERQQGESKLSKAVLRGVGDHAVAPQSDARARAVNPFHVKV